MRTTVFRLHFLLLCTLLLSLAACDPSRRASGTTNRPKPPPKKVDTQANATMDTVRWTEPSVTVPPPISTDAEGAGNVGVDPTRTYKVALLLPFLSNKFDETTNTVPSKSKYGLHFYSGAKLAFEQLSIEEPQLKLRVDVIDSYVSDADFYKAVENPLLESADLIIGPVRSSHVRILEKKTKVYGTPIISPFSPSDNLVSEYPNYYQVNPSLQAHCTALVDYALTSYAPEQIVLVCREKERSRLAYFQEVAQARGISAFREIIESDKVDNAEFDLKKEISAIKPTVFLVPSWSSETFVNSFLRALKTQKGKSEVLVFGMPQWEKYERIESELLAESKVHIVHSSWVNASSEAVQAFKDSYINTYGTVPAPYAYDGYDIAFWTGKMLAKYGLSLGGGQQNEVMNGLRNAFLFSEKIDAAGVVQQKENKQLFILRYENGQYLPVSAQ